VPDIRKSAVDALRAAVTAAHAEYKKTYNEQMATLTASENWKKLNAGQCKQILVDEAIDTLPALAVGSESDSSARWNKHRCRRGRPRPTRFPNSSLAQQWRG